LFVKRWDYGTVERAISTVVAHAEGPDLPAVAARIARYGRWEFEAYR
jgi:hypothetical protein